MLVRWRKQWLDVFSSRGMLSLLAFFAVVVFLSDAISPQYVLEQFAQAWDIVYLNLPPLPFSSLMISLMSASLGLVSFNLTIAWRPRGAKSMSCPSLTDCWRPVLRNLACFLWLVLLLHRVLGSANQFSVFAVLMMSLMLVPFFSTYASFEKHYKVVRILVGGAAGASLLQILLNFEDFLSAFSPTHPFIVVPLFSFIAVCCSCAIGEICAINADLRSLRGIETRTVMCLAILVGAAASLTWFCSHAAYSVWI